MEHDNHAIGYEQARRLGTTMTAAGIERRQLWLYYFSIGGDVSEFELDAYLHHSIVLPRLQRDLFAQAANEMLSDLRPPEAPFTAELLNGDGQRVAPDGDPLSVNGDPGVSAADEYGPLDGPSATRHDSEQSGGDVAGCADD